MNVPSPLLRYRRLVSVASPFGPQLTGSPFQVQFAPCPGLGRRRQIEREIVGDEQIEVAVAIDVEQRTAGAPAIAGGSEAGLRRDVLEASLAEVPVQHVAAEVGDEQIDAPVAVRIAGAHARRPADAVEPRGRRRVDEPSAHVAIQPDPRRLPGRPRPVAPPGGLELRAVQRHEVDPPVLVEIDHRHAAAIGLDDEALARRIAVGDGMREAGLAATSTKRTGHAARGIRLRGADQRERRQDRGARGQHRGTRGHSSPRVASRSAMANCSFASSARPSCCRSCASR